MIATEVQIGPSRFQLGDLIIHYAKPHNGSPIQPENLIGSIQDANSKPWFRVMPAGLLEVHRAAIQTFGWYFERIRCMDCGARKIPQALTGNRCPSCADAWNKAHPWRPEVHDAQKERNRRLDNIYVWGRCEV